MQAEGATNIAARAGRHEGVTSTAAMSGVTRDSNAANIDASSFAGANSRRGADPDVCPKSSKPDDNKPQTAYVSLCCPVTSYEPG